MKIALDAGHGLTTPGKRTPDGEQEWKFNNQVIITAGHYLNEYQEVEILRLDDPTGKTDVPLAARTQKANAWGADILISCHHNANTGKWGNWTGTETYSYTGNWPKAERLAILVHREVVQAYKIENRGLKKANFHMLRESRMPAILIEGAFMDSKIDIQRMRNSQVLNQVGKAIANGVSKYFDLNKTVSNSEIPIMETYQLKQTAPGFMTAADAQGNRNKQGALQPGTYFIYNNANGMINITKEKDAPGSWIHPETFSAPTFLIKVIVENLWYYNHPNWQARKGIVKKGEVFTVKEILTVNGANMYKLKSGHYITANSKYVKRI